MQLPANDRVKRLVAGRVFDPYTLSFEENRIITISEDSGLIIDVRPFTVHDWEANGYETDPSVVDMRQLTVLPGFVDAHVHFFLHPYEETSWDDQLTKESLAERTVRATLHARRTIMAGYTAVRDLGTEGAGDADVALRKCLSGPSPLIPGPRYFCANRAIVATGAYGPKSTIYPNQEGIDGVTGAEVADGRDECRKAVRRQIAAGADWIKVYANYRFRSRAIQVSSEAGRASMATFANDELQELISTAALYGVKVAAHSTEYRTIQRIRGYGVRSIEHGYDLLGVNKTDEELAEDLKDILELGSDLESRPGYTPTFWVPTLCAYYSPDGGELWNKIVRTFQTALRLGANNIVCGGDTGVFPHGENALEMKLMVQLGAPWRKVLSWATLGGWKCIRSMKWEGRAGEQRLRDVELLREDARIIGDNEVPFGVIRKGFAADIIATSGNLEDDFETAVSADSIVFVMKGGKVFKQNGQEVSWP